MTKRNKIIYWISTLWLLLGMLSTGTLQLFKAKAEGAVAPPGVYGITHLGYPIYFLTILGVWKILGVVALLIPKFPLLKEWAYAGFFFAMSGAVFSHIASGDSMTANVPALLLLILTVISWYFRPADRKVISVNQYSHGQEFGPPKTATERHGNHGTVGA
jgi:DoxX-like family